MTRRKSVCLKLTLVLVLVVFCPYACSRPQEPSQSVVSSSSTLEIDKPTEDPIRDSSQKIQEDVKHAEVSSSLTASPNTSRDVKKKVPIIGESIKVVASQLLEKPSNVSEEPVVIDTRIPPKLKTKLAHKHKIKTRNEDGDEPMENSHAGIAVPVTMEELETENKINNNIPSESSTTNEGISTWILLSNTANKDNSTVSTEATKIEEPQKKPKPAPSKNKTKRPQNNKTTASKRPIIGSVNKSDLVAGGSAINENVLNKIKDTVLSNVQKNKNTPHRTTTTTTSTAAPTTETTTTRKEITKAPTSIIPVVKVTSKPKKNKNKPKTSTTEAPIKSESAMLPMEPKEQEIELEVSTPATTTKKPKRSSTRKKTKTKKRKTSKPKPEVAAPVASEVKQANKTKLTKVSKKPATTAVSGPITTQIYNYLSREVMPSVGVGVLGLASLVGIASYFLYPFTTPVRRTFEVDKKDDIYRNNAEEYASEGNGQAEEEMLGTVLAGMPAHSKQKLNPYVAQTPHINRYQIKKDQDIRYRQVTAKYDPNYNVRYPQQKTGIAHAAVYAEPVNYNHHQHQHQQYETRHAYTTEVKYDKGPSSYAPYPAVEPIYAAPQTGPSGISGYGDSSNSVVYGVKPSSDSDFKPVYPYEAQFYSETTNSPVTYSPTSMYLGSNSEEEEDSDSDKFSEDTSVNTSSADNKFVVGNVPKELTDSATPAVVPEHGPRKLERRRRNMSRTKRSIVSSIDELLKAAKQSKDVFISNEISEGVGMPTKAPPSMTKLMAMKNKDVSGLTRVIPVYAVSMDPKETTTEAPSTIKTELIESVSTVPIDSKSEKTTATDMSNELEVTTRAFRVYEVFSSNPSVVEEQSSPLVQDESNTTHLKSVNTETTTEFKSETTSTMPPSTSSISEFTTTFRPTYYPEVITYPPLNQDGGFFSFLKRLVEFKYRLGLSLLQTTSDSLTKYLNSVKETVENTARASS